LERRRVDAFDFRRPGTNRARCGAPANYHTVAVMVPVPIVEDDELTEFTLRPEKARVSMNLDVPNVPSAVAFPFLTEPT
jgi:hypothetical protein